MHEIEHVHRRTFFCNLALCIFVCFVAVFHVHIGGFDVLSVPGAAGMKDSMALLSDGIFQILISMVIILLGYLAWANFRSLNIILGMWYVVVIVVGIVRGDYLTGLVGAVGVVFYFFSFRELRHEESLAQMEGYPEFHEKLDISKSDYVVQTLMAHKDERWTNKKKPHRFSSEPSLRKMKKRSEVIESDGNAGEALAAELQKQLDKVQHPEQETAAEPEKPVSADAENTPAEQSAGEMTDLIADQKSGDSADAIIAEAEARAKEILAEAVAKANAVRSESASEQPKQPNHRGGKKKRR